MYWGPFLSEKLKDGCSFVEVGFGFGLRVWWANLNGTGSLYQFFHRRRTPLFQASAS
jgi:hypothetical protein